jgi:hypothetical protein
MMSSNQRKQLMARGFLYCAVVLVLAMCGIASATAQFPPLSAPQAKHCITAPMSMVMRPLVGAEFEQTRAGPKQ